MSQICFASARPHIRMQQGPCSDPSSILTVDTLLKKTTTNMSKKKIEDVTHTLAKVIVSTCSLFSYAIDPWTNPNIPWKYLSHRKLSSQLRAAGAPAPYGRDTKAITFIFWRRASSPYWRRRGKGWWRSHHYRNGLLIDPSHVLWICFCDVVITHTTVCNVLARWPSS
jgi:hypothetical protein